VAQGASVVKVAAALKRKIISVRTHARAIGCPFPPLRPPEMGRYTGCRPEVINPLIDQYLYFGRFKSWSLLALYTA
jgi:hypothetical protein